MRDMNFLKNLGSEDMGNSGDQGSMINGMTAEQYAASLDEEEEYGDPGSSYEQPSYAQHDQMSGSGADLSDLPLTEISDMDAPVGGDQSAGTERPAGFASTNRYGGNPSANSQPAGFGSSSRYSANSYGNTSYTAPEPDSRTLRQRRVAAAAANENIGLGMIGGILGAILGTIVWAFIASIGYISWIGAVAIVAGSFFGYLLFAKDIGRGGALVVCLLIIAAVYFGNRLGYTIILHTAIEKLYNNNPAEFASDYEVPSMFDIFKNMKYYINDYHANSAYNRDMMMSYMITGAASAVFFVKRLR